MLVLNKKTLYCLYIRLNCNVLEYIYCSKYLDFKFNIDVQDDDDMLRQMRSLLYNYIRSNKLLRTFHYCSIDVKLDSFRSCCSSFYCCYLMTAFTKSTFDKLRVAFKRAFRHDDAVPVIYVNFSIQIAITSGKSTYGFIQQQNKNTGILVMTVKNHGLAVLIYRLFVVKKNNVY